MKIKDISGEGLLLDPYMKWEQERRKELITPCIQEERRQGQSEDKEIPWGYQDKVSREKHQPRDLYPHCRKAAGAQQQTRELLLVARACGAEKIKWGRQTPQSWEPSHPNSCTGNGEAPNTGSRDMRLLRCCPFPGTGATDLPKLTLCTHLGVTLSSLAAFMNRTL